MENNTITKLIFGFVTLIVGISLIGAVAQQSNIATSKLGIANETFNIGVIGQGMIADGCSGGSINISHPYTIANPPTSWKITDCPIASVVIRNQTQNTATVTTDYVFFANNGTFFLKNTTRYVEDDCSGTGDVTNVTTVDYQYCGNDYINIAWGRSVLSLVSGFFALALLGASVGLFYSVGKDAGLIN